MTATPLHLPQQDVVKGSLYMAAAMAAFVSNDTLVKLLASELPVGTLVFIRGAFASVVLLAATAASGNLQKLPLIFSRDVTLRAGTKNAEHRASAHSRRSRCLSVAGLSVHGEYAALHRHIGLCLDPFFGGPVGIIVG